MANLLRVKRIDEISLVDKGASGNATVKPAIVIAKRRSSDVNDKKTEGVLAKILKAIGLKAESGMTLEEVLSKLGDAEKAVILNALEAAAMKAGPPMMPAEEEEKPEEEKRKATLAKQLAELPDEIRKSLVDAEKAKGEAAELRKRLDAIEEEREMEAFTAKAKSMPFLAGASTVEVAKALRAVKRQSPGEYEKIVKVLELADTAVKSSKIFSAPGMHGSGPDEPVGKLHAIAKKLVSDGVAKTKHEAMGLALKDNPELYAEYKQELYDRARGLQ